MENYGTFYAPGPPTNPGGSSGTLQYNNSGAFGGLSGSSISGANLTLGGTLTLPATIGFIAGDGNASVSMGNSDTAGDLTIQGRNALTTATGGAINLAGGNGVGGTFTHSDGGAITLRAGDAGTNSSYASGGAVNILSGSPPVNQGVSGGPINITAHNGAGNFNGGGSVNITAGSAAPTGVGGSVSIAPGGGGTLGSLNLGTATSQKVGFYGTASTTQQTVTGSKGGNAALISLMAALAAMGMVVDSTS